jgi:hypothetical protein
VYIHLNRNSEKFSNYLSASKCRVRNWRVNVSISFPIPAATKSIYQDNIPHKELSFDEAIISYACKNTDLKKVVEDATANFIDRMFNKNNAVFMSVDNLFRPTFPCLDFYRDHIQYNRDTIGAFIRCIHHST